MLIRPLVNIVGNEGVLIVGHVVDTSDPRAEDWVKRGLAAKATKAEADDPPPAPPDDTPPLAPAEPVARTMRRRTEPEAPKPGR